MFKNIKKSISWLLIISMLFTSHISSAFADSFDDAINDTPSIEQTTLNDYMPTEPFDVTDPTGSSTEEKNTNQENDNDNENENENADNENIGSTNNNEISPAEGSDDTDIANNDNEEEPEEDPTYNQEDNNISSGSDEATTDQNDDSATSSEEITSSSEEITSSSEEITSSSEEITSSSEEVTSSSEEITSSSEEITSSSEETTYTINNIATDSETIVNPELIDDFFISTKSNVVIKVDEDIATQSNIKEIFGNDVPWAYYYFISENNTNSLHFNNDPSCGGRALTTSGEIVYTFDTTVGSRGDIHEVVFDNLIAAKTCDSLFHSFAALTTIKNIANLNTSNVTNMREMFCGCSQLQSIDVSYFDTSNVTDMKKMFYGCGVKTLNLTSFNTANVTNMALMFAECKNLTSLNVSKFKTTKVTDMGGMFYNVKSIESLDLSSFVTTNVVNMSLMFENCQKLKTINISKFDTSNVTTMSRMFCGCWELSSINLSNFKTPKLQDMATMFGSCMKLTTIDLSGFDTQNVTNISKLFYRCEILKTINMSNLDLSNVTTMEDAFYKCLKATTIDLTGTITSGKLKNMEETFYYCEQVTTLDLSGFDTSGVTNMKSCFSGSVTVNDDYDPIAGLKTIYASKKFVTDSVTNGSNMFSSCLLLKGGAGTAYEDAGVSGYSYARIDTTTSPGYFTGVYNLVYDKNGGEGETIATRTNLISGNTYKLDKNVYTKEDCYYGGWVEDPTKTTKDWDDESTTFKHIMTDADTGDFKLYALWKKMKYNLKFDLQGGSGTFNPMENQNSGENVILPTDEPTKTNFKFLGWATSPTEDVSYAPGDSVMYKLDLNTYDKTEATRQVRTLYAKWGQFTYKVSYDKNGGQGTDMPNSNGESGTDLTLSANTYTKTGYRFRGWDENQNPTDPTNPMYPANNMVMNKIITEADDGSTIKVYAIWTKISFNLVYDANAGSGTVTGSVPPSTTVYPNEQITLAYNSGGTQGNLNYAGKYLLGWATQSNAINPKYPLGGTMTLIDTEAIDGGDVIVYAIWGNVPYRIKLYNNGGVGDAVEISAQSDVDANLPENTFTRVNYQFVGWSRDHNIDPTNFDTTIEGNYPVSGGVVNRTIDDSHANSEYILYAIWKQYTYTLRYDMNAGTDTSVDPLSLTDITEVGSGDNIALTTTKPTRNNYSFLGWADTNTATVEQYQPGGYYKATVDSDGQTKTVYAVWLYCYPYTVSFDSNGGEGNMDNIIATSAITSPLPLNEFTKDGYIFVGWAENDTDIIATYVGNIYKKFNNAGNVVNLYAVWKQAPIISGGGSMNGATAHNSIINYVPVTHENDLQKGFYNVTQNNTINTYYKEQNGKNIEGWLRTYDAKWYLFEYEPTVNKTEKGKMIRGFRYVTDAWFFFNGNGQMATDFKEINNNTYYFETTKDRNEGKMATGWKKIGEKWYYFAFNGIMLRNQTTPDGYRVGQDGAWIDDNISHNTAIKVIYHKQ